MLWIYLSPHFDDVALSCGGMVWEQVQQGDAVAVWTICGGSPAPGQPYSAFAQHLHARWETGLEAVPVRQAEDIASCQVMGASWRHFPLADCIYRTSQDGQPLYPSEESLWGEISPEELPLIQSLAQTFRQDIPAQAQIVCPLSLGDHVDHKLVRAAAEQTAHQLFYYADYPYAIKPETQPRLAALLASSWERLPFTVSCTGLSAWQDAVAAHRSQISSFWSRLEEMRQALESYWQAQGEAVVLLSPPLNVPRDLKRRAGNAPPG